MSEPAQVQVSGQEHLQPLEEYQGPVLVHSELVLVLGLLERHPQQVVAQVIL